MKPSVQSLGLSNDKLLAPLTAGSVYITVWSHRKMQCIALVYFSAMNTVVIQNNVTTRGKSFDFLFDTSNYLLFLSVKYIKSD
jgi:hypothetical protein